MNAERKPVTRTNYSFDPRALDLAVYFLLDDEHADSNADDLAQVIQDAVEGYFEGLELKAVEKQ